MRDKSAALVAAFLRILAFQLPTRSVADEVRFVKYLMGYAQCRRPVLTAICVTGIVVLGYKPCPSPGTARES